MISQTAEYALRAVACLALELDSSVTTEQLAKITKIPSGYLAKVLQSLGRAELVRSQRGLYGGFVLARPPHRITLLEVINAIDPIRRIRSCPLQLKSHQKGLCPLHRRLDNAMAVLERTFQDTTIADLLDDSTGPKPLCELSISPAGRQEI